MFIWVIASGISLSTTLFRLILVFSNFYWLNSENIRELFLYLTHEEYIDYTSGLWAKTKEEKEGGEEMTEVTSEKSGELEGKDQDENKGGGLFAVEAKISSIGDR